MKKKNIGSTFDSWLRKEGLHEQVTATAIERILARKNLTLPDRPRPSGS